MLLHSCCFALPSCCLDDAVACCRCCGQMAIIGCCWQCVCCLCYHSYALELALMLLLFIVFHSAIQDCIFFANDWQAGLVPVYLLYKYKRNGTYRNARSVFVIHNLGYQGKYQLSKFPIDSHLGLPSEAIHFLQGEDLNLLDDCLNLLSAGVLL